VAQADARGIDDATQPRMRTASLVIGLSTLLISSAAFAEEAADDTEPAMRSGVVFGLGVGMMTVGAAGVVTGAAVFTSREDACDGLREKGADLTRDDVDSCVAATHQQIGSIVGMATGGAFFLFGLPLAIFGGTTPAKKEAAAEVPTVAASVSPTEAAVRVRMSF
jgi:hypothetical protein